MSRSSTGAILVILSSLAFGTLALFARRAFEAGFSQVTLLAVRFDVALLCLAVLALVRRPVWPDRRRLAGLAVIGGLYVGQSFTYFAALRYLPTGMVSLLLYLYPAIVTCGALIFFKERMTGAKWLALAFAFGGSILMVGISGEVNPTGISLGVMTAVFYSAYLLVGSRVLPGVDALASSLVVIGVVAVVYTLGTLVQGVQFPMVSNGWVWAVLLGIVPTFVAISTLLAGLERIGPVATSTLAAVEPLATATLGILFLGERIGWLQAFGGVCILSAVVILAKAASTQAVSSPTT